VSIEKAVANNDANKVLEACLTNTRSSTALRPRQM
jgi:hypothetical protein